MRELFSAVLSMSITGGIVIVFVLIARLLLKKAPKGWSYALWAVVLFRLLCPVALTGGFSILGLFDVPASSASDVTSRVEYFEEPSSEENAVINTAPVLPDAGAITGTAPALPDTNVPVQTTPAQDVSAGTEDISAPDTGVKEKTKLSAENIVHIVWLAGVIVMLAYSAVSLIALKRKLREAVPVRDNIYAADHLETPFVMGLIKPRIYLPSTLTEKEQKYIILHERHHIDRFDHIIKLLFFAALCVHWFNPLVWLAFILSGKDMEMSCDEAVLKMLGEDIRADYFASLLALSTGRRMIAGVPLAFGEGDAKSRIKNLLRFKRPRLAVTVTAAVLCIAVIAACAINPSEKKDSEKDDAAEKSDEEKHQDELSEAISRAVNGIFVGSVTGDNTWQNSEMYTLTAGDDINNRTDTYTSLPGEGYKGWEYTPGNRLWDNFTWTEAEVPERGQDDISFEFKNSSCAFTVYSSDNTLRIENEKGVRYYFGASEVAADTYNNDYSEVFNIFLSYANAAETANAYSMCVYTEEFTWLYETDIAIKLAELFMEEVTDRPFWYRGRADEAVVTDVEIYDAYRGTDNPNFCFELTYKVKFSEEQFEYWVPAEPSGPDENGFYEVDYQVLARTNGDGDWCIGGMGSGGHNAELPIEAHEASIEQLIEFYPLTEGNSHDYLIPLYLAQYPYGEVKAALDAMEPLEATRIWTSLRRFFMEFPEYYSWDGHGKDETNAYTALQAAINGIFVGKMEADSAWSYPGEYTITAVDTVSGRTDTYTALPLDNYSAWEFTPGYCIPVKYEWQETDSLGFDPDETDCIYIEYRNADLAVTVFSTENVLLIEDENGSRCYLAVPDAERVFGTNGFSSLFNDIRNCAPIPDQYTILSYEWCSVSGSETDYEVIAKELSRQYAALIADRPAWVPQTAEDARVSSIEIFDAYYGEDRPNFCFNLGMRIKVPEGNRLEWEVGSGLSEPDENGYYGWGMEATVCKNENGDWHISGLATGGSSVLFPEQGDITRAEHLMRVYFLTEGWSHDWIIPCHLVEEPIEDIKAAMEKLSESEAREMRSVLLNMAKEHPDLCAWTAVDLE